MAIQLRNRCIVKIGFLCNHFIALPTLEKLLREKNIVGVGVPVIEHEPTAHALALAQQHSVVFHTFDPQALEQQLVGWLTQTEAELVIVFSFPYKIPARVLGVPIHGFYNLHPGPLPAYRGPDPVFWQIANQEPHAGITVHRMDATLDTGPIVEFFHVPLTPYDTYKLYINKLAASARERLIDLVDRLPLMEGVAQQPDDSDYLHRPQPETLIVDWNRQSASQIDALVRAGNHGFGGAVTGFRGKLQRVLEPPLGLETGATSHPAGTIGCADLTEGLGVTCGDGTVLYLNIVHTNEGFFSGSRLVEVLNIEPGESMSRPHSLNS